MNRVLIVDDKEENLYFLQALLANDDCVVEAARNGEEALEIARRKPPDLVVSDLLMPVMDGFTLLRHWKSDERLRRIPFIVFTATYTDADDEKLALSLGADAFILKPTDPEQLLARICAVRATAEAGATDPRRMPAADEHVRLTLYNEVLITQAGGEVGAPGGGQQSAGGGAFRAPESRSRAPADGRDPDGDSRRAARPHRAAG